ncbi:MAG: sortase, partial [Propionibacteriaceae bacterium]|nr:sortase [Propionibacteriaceae bacterium]
REEWASTTSSSSEQEPAASGEPVALLRIPAFGPDYEQPILAGTDAETLTRGLGWYAGTAAPGEVGNFAVAGRRGVTGPLAPIGRLASGDEIVVETGDAVHTYAVSDDPAPFTVAETDTWVLQPVPGRPEIQPTEALLTLTTGQELVRSPERLVVFATLVSSQPK